MNQLTMTTQSQENNKRIAKNTLLLYVRMFVMMLVALYTNRVVLDKLGVVDYGIYNVVGGIVAMLGFLSGCMSNTVQRFLSFEMGKENSRAVNRVFNASLVVHYGIAIIVFAVMEVVGVWYLNVRMNIPLDRLDAANWVLQCTILSTMFTIVQVPYNAMIIAKERMGIYAYLSILEVILKLVIVYLLVLGSFDRLKMYSVLFAATTIAVLMIYRIYCRWHFPETKFQWIKDLKLFKEILSFSGWNMLSELAWTLTGPGVNLILNVFFGPVVNAAMGLATQVNGAVLRFTANFQTAVNPQIIKLFASNQIAEMKKLLFLGTRFSFYLMLVISLPLILEMKYILGIWLKEVPEYTTEFCQLTLICSLVSVTSNFLPKIAWANGNIRNFQIIISSILVLNFPISFLVLYLGASPLSVMVISIAIRFILIFMQLFLVCRIIDMVMSEFVKDALFPIVKVAIAALIFPLLAYKLVADNFIGFLIVAFVSILSASVCAFWIGMNANERKFVRNALLNMKTKIMRG